MNQLISSNPQWKIFGEEWANLPGIRDTVYSAYSWHSNERYSIVPTFTDIIEEDDVSQYIFDEFISILLFDDPEEYTNVPEDDLEAEQFTTKFYNEGAVFVPQILQDLRLLLSIDKCFYQEIDKTYKNIPIVLVW